MKNKAFFYQQYEKINWENQEKTKINSLVNDYIIKEIILKHKSPTIKIFDIGFGIGFFVKMLYRELIKNYKEIILEGCDPSERNYNYFVKNVKNEIKGINLKTYKETFQDVKTDNKFDFITSIYTFTNFIPEDVENATQKIYSMLKDDGKLILVVSNEKYLKKKIKTKKDLFIEKNTIKLNGKDYEEILHYSDIPEIGKVIDYNREEKFYIDLFEKNKFKLTSKRDLNDSGFICTVFVFEKK